MSQEEAVRFLRDELIKEAVERRRLEQQLAAIRAALGGHPDSDLVALAEATMRQSDMVDDHGPDGRNVTNAQFVEMRDRAEKAEQQVAVLRGAIADIVDDYDEGRNMAASITDARVLQVEDGPRMVRFADVERVFRPLTERPLRGETDTARAWLDEAKR